MIKGFEDLIIREANGADQTQIVAFVRSILKEFNQEYDAEGSENDLENFRNYYLSTGCVFYVIVKGHTIIATIGLLLVSSQTAKIKKMYVHPKFRKLGLAKTLLEKVIVKAQEIGFLKLSLETMSVMQAAMNLYKKYGFSEVKINAQSQRCDIVMEKLL